MAEIVNLRRAKKARKREQEREDAAASRAAHGRTKAEKDAAEAERRRIDRALDAAALDRD